MERLSTTVQGVSSATFTTSGTVCPGASPGRSRRGDELATVPRPSLHSPKEELRQAASYPRPVDPESVHLMSLLQDDHGERRQECTTQRGLDNVHRSQGRLLARPDKSAFQEILGIQPGRQEVSLHSDAFRAECCPPSIYEIDQTNPERVTPSGHKRLSVFGRLAGVGKFSGSVSSCDPHSPSDVRKEGFLSEFCEIPPHTSKVVRVAGDPLGHQQGDAVPSQGFSLSDDETRGSCS